MRSQQCEQDRCPASFSHRNWCLMFNIWALDTSLKFIWNVLFFSFSSELIKIVLYFLPWQTAQPVLLYPYTTEIDVVTRSPLPIHPVTPRPPSPAPTGPPRRSLRPDQIDLYLYPMSTLRCPRRVAPRRRGVAPRPMGRMESGITMDVILVFRRGTVSWRRTAEWEVREIT